MASSSQADLHEKLAAILGICQKMNSERDLGALLDLMAHEATNFLDCDRASIFLLDRQRNELWSKVALGSEEILRFDARFGIVGQAVLTGNPVNVPDAYSHPQFYTAIDDQTGYRTRNVLAVPVRNQSGQIVGAFEALNKRIGAFGPRDEAALEALASHAAIAVETAQLIGELRRNQDELAQQNANLLREVESKYSTHGIIGVGPKIQQVVRLVERIRDSAVNVLITGESGTGKELVAKAVHYTSPRARRGFVALNCAALPDTLVESELFGIEKGVATGVQSRVGHIEKADGGTLFLDEIADLSLAAQAKILRVLQEREFERVGGNRTIKVDVRVIAATNQDLEAKVQDGSFREDLYYRLKVVPIALPGLRERPEDVPILIEHFLRSSASRLQREPKRVAPEAYRALLAAEWKGNVRELEHAIEQAVVLSSGPEIQLSDFPSLAAAVVSAEDASEDGRSGHFREAKQRVIERFERQFICEALERHRGNISKAAEEMGMYRQHLQVKLADYGIDATAYRRDR
ncbi:MAG: sigma-54-dependent Fis family transcriptional regulator [Acidobacteriia bacterium]|nr:sigma-54-dependent Fis family transcriptional regulator [Terriglobia bacterium]